MIYGCGNCLITRPVILPGSGIPSFDLRFNFLGGGTDTGFFRALPSGWNEILLVRRHSDCRNRFRQAGPIPDGSRCGGLRIGAINYHVELKTAGTARNASSCWRGCSHDCPYRWFSASRLVVTEHQPHLRHCTRWRLPPAAPLAAIGNRTATYKASKIAS